MTGRKAKPRRINIIRTLFERAYRESLSGQGPTDSEGDDGLAGSPGKSRQNQTRSIAHECVRDFAGDANLRDGSGTNRSVR